MYSLFEQTLLAYRHHFFFIRKKDKEKSLNNVYIGNITEKERAREIGKTDRHRQIDRQTEALFPGQKPEDHPDLVARVFKQKLKALLAHIKKAAILGRVVAIMQIIVFQKRGLPHAHILIILRNEHRLQTADPVNFNYDSPEKSQAQRLIDIVLQTMLPKSLL